MTTASTMCFEHIREYSTIGDSQGTCPFVEVQERDFRGSIIGEALRFRGLGSGNEKHQTALYAESAVTVNGASSGLVHFLLAIVASLAMWLTVMYVALAAICTAVAMIGLATVCMVLFCAIIE